MGRHPYGSEIIVVSEEGMFPMIPPQVNGATKKTIYESVSIAPFPMIPPQVNGAT
jgi:hypothetical protein